PHRDQTCGLPRPFRKNTPRKSPYGIPLPEPCRLSPAAVCRSSCIPLTQVPSCFRFYIFSSGTSLQASVFGFTPAIINDLSENSHREWFEHLTEINIPNRKSTRLNSSHVS